MMFSSVQFSHSVMSNSLWPHGQEHARFPCSSPTPGVCSNSCLSSWWCHPTIILCHPLLLPPSIFASSRVFSNESVLRIRWPTYWSFSFSISPSNEYSGLISFRIDWFDLFAVQMTLKSLLQLHSLKASIQPSLWSNPHICTWLLEKPWLWLYGPFVSKVMSLLFNTLSRFVIAFLPRGKHLSISYLQSLYTVIVEPKKIKSTTASPFLPCICHKVMRQDAIRVFQESIIWSGVKLEAMQLMIPTFSHRLGSHAQQVTQHTDTGRNMLNRPL